jgi:uncharacterized DUF497 family protein
LFGCINASTFIPVETRLTWDEAKRQTNLRKHGLDFADACEVLESRFRLDLPEMPGGEDRVRSISYALGFLAVLDGGVHRARRRCARHQLSSCKHART